MPGQRVAVYARISREGEEEQGEESLENQIAVARKRIAEEDAIRDGKVTVYQDLGYSGTSMNRPAVKKLLADLYMGRIDVVVVKDFSRWSRNYLNLAEFLEYIFPERGVRFISVGDGYDSAGEGSSFGNAIRGIFYEYYCRDVSRKVQSALDARKKSGIYAVAKAPYGYCRDGRGGFIPVPEEAELVRRIFAMAGDGRNSAQIGRELGRDGSWVWRVLHNPVYMGQQVWCKSRSRYRNGFYREYLPRGDWQRQKGSHMPIVSEEEYEQAQAAQRRRLTGVDGRRPPHLFHGLTKCGVCGKALCRKRREDEVICCKEIHGGEFPIPVEGLWRICCAAVCTMDGTAEGMEEGRGFWNILGGTAGADRVCERQRRIFLQHFFERITVGTEDGGGVGRVLYLDVRCRGRYSCTVPFTFR